MSLHPFVSAVAAVRFENSFNPYTDRCEVYDRHNAPHCRAASLSAMVDRAVEGLVDAIWVGRDLGYRGGRRTGLALTDDVNLARHAQRWKLVAERPTIGAAVAERTAAVIWSILDQIESNVFLWNVFPLHPYQQDEPFTNRQHNTKERKAGEEILDMLFCLLRPTRIIAIGNDAAASAKYVSDGIPVTVVRHPSYGGQSQFLSQIAGLYDIRTRNDMLF